MKNQDVRRLVADCKLKYKDVAKEMRITPEWLSRLLREDLSPKNRERVLSAIGELEGRAVFNDLR